MQKFVTLKNQKLTMRNINILFILVCFLVGIFTSYVTNYRVLIVFTFVLSFLILFRTKKNYLLLIMFGIIFYCNYSILMLVYIRPDNSLFSSENFTSIGYTSLQILFLFNFVVYLFLPEKIKEFKFYSLYSSTKIHPIIHILNMILIFDITLLGRSSNGESALWGYVVILLLLGLYFSNRDRKLKYAYLALGCVFAIKSLISFGRSSLTQVLIVLFLYFCPRKLIKKTLLILVGMLCVYFAFNFVGIFRSNRDLGFVQVFILTIKQVLGYMFAVDTASSAYFTGETFVKMALNDSVLKRFYMFGLLIIYMIVGGGVLPQANLPEYTHNFYTHYYGGVLPFYGWYYLGGLGVILLAFLITYIVRKINVIKIDTKYGFVTPILILIVSSTFLWYLYHPSSLVRTPLIFFVGYYAFIYGSKIIEWFLLKIEKK